MERPTDEQTTAFGHLVADNIGAHLQTGFAGDGCFYIYVQHHNDETPKRYEVLPDGEVQT